MHQNLILLGIDYICYLLIQCTTKSKLLFSNQIRYSTMKCSILTTFMLNQLFKAVHPVKTTRSIKHMSGLKLTTKSFVQKWLNYKEHRMNARILIKYWINKKSLKIKSVMTNLNLQTDLFRRKFTCKTIKKDLFTTASKETDKQQ